MLTWLPFQKSLIIEPPVSSLLETAAALAISLVIAFIWFGFISAKILTAKGIRVFSLPWSSVYLYSLLVLTLPFSVSKSFSPVSELIISLPSASFFAVAPSYLIRSSADISMPNCFLNRLDVFVSFATSAVSSGSRFLMVFSLSGTNLNASSIISFFLYRVRVL